MVIQEAYKKLKDIKKRSKEDILVFNYVKGEFAFNIEEKNTPAFETLNHDIKQFEGKLQENPGDPEIKRKILLLFMQRSFHSVRKKRWGEAIEDWQRVLNLDPTNTRAKNNLLFSYLTLGYSYAQHGLVSEAMDLWEKSYPIG